MPRSARPWTPPATRWPREGRSSGTRRELRTFTFRITDERGRVVRDELELEHDKELRVIVVRRLQFKAGGGVRTVAYTMEVPR